MTTQIERINGNLNVIMQQIEDNFSTAKLLAMSPGVAQSQKDIARAEVKRLTRVMELVELVIDDVNRMQNIVELKHLSRKTYDVVVAYVNAHRNDRNQFQADWNDGMTLAASNDEKWAIMGGTRN